MLPARTSPTANTQPLLPASISSRSIEARFSPSATRVLTVNGSRIDSRELFATEREIIISHGEEKYRLRLTSQNKLILTK